MPNLLLRTLPLLIMGLLLSSTLLADDKEKSSRGVSGAPAQPNAGRGALGGNAGRSFQPETKPGAGSARLRNATQQGDGLPKLNLDPNSNAAKILQDRGLPTGDRRPNPPTNLNRDNRPLTGAPGNQLDRTPRLNPNNPVVQSKVDKNGLASDLHKNPQLAEEFNRLQGTRNPHDVDQFFTKVKTDPALKNSSLASMNVNHLSGNFQKNIHEGGYPQLLQSNVGANLHLAQQYHVYANGGDVARQLNLNQTFLAHGGWTNRYIGPVYPRYTTAAFSAWYPGPGFYPAYTWMPLWSPWVSWSFWNHCVPIYDPRPFICRPILYLPGPPLVAYNYPVFQPLPVVSSGTWVDVPPVIVDSGFDLQLLAVRFVDPGYTDQNLGPRYRVWVRNNSAAAIGAPFNVTLVAANSPTLPAQDIVQAGVSLPSINANEVVPVDIRLPAASNQLQRTPEGRRTPFGYLHVLVDSHHDVAETNKVNNGTAIARGDILPVDPAAFSTDVTAATPGGMVTVAGEGFGPEPGQVIVMVDNVPQQAEVYGWYDLGVNFKLPASKAAGATDAQVLIVRGDGAASNPVTLALAPQHLLTEAPLPPAPMP